MSSITKAVVPIAGLGSRMAPFAGAVPKAFLPLVDGGDAFTRPFLHVLLASVLDASTGIAEVALVVSPDQIPLIESYFGLPREPDARAEPPAAFVDAWAPYVAKGARWAAEVEAIAELGGRLTLLVQDVPMGFGHAVLMAKEWVSPDPYFLLALGDHVYTASMGLHPVNQLLEAFASSPGSITSVGRTPLAMAPVSGILVPAPGSVPDAAGVFELGDMAEKPDVDTARARYLPPPEFGGQPDDLLCNFGMDILPALVFDKLETQEATQSGECELRVGQLDVLRETGMRGVLINGERHDTGLPHEYMGTLVAHYLATASRVVHPSNSLSGSSADGAPFTLVEQAVATWPWSDSAAAASTAASGYAPGRVDVMGGIADYSGSLVLQAPTVGVGNLATAALVAAAGPGPVVRVSSAAAPDPPFEIELAALVAARGACTEIRAVLEEAGAPTWARYMLAFFGSGLVTGVIDGDALLGGGCDVCVHVVSSLPQGKGLASSASVEVAVGLALRTALGLQLTVSRKDVALLCQKGENLIVGAPCGIMDQLAVAMGTPGSLLAILCRPDLVEGTVAVPPAISFINVASEARHTLAATTSRYTVVRAAAFMGARALGVSVLTESIAVHELDTIAASLPVTMTKAEFEAAYGAGAHLDAAVTPLEDGIAYPVRDSVCHAVREHARVRLFRALLAVPVPSRDTKSLLGTLMLESHASYSRLGLGSEATDALVDKAMAHPAVWGAKITGGGCGGTVVILADAAFVEDVRAALSL